MCERCIEGRREFAKSVPALRAEKGLMPVVPAGPEAVLVDVDEQTQTLYVGDTANDVAHVFVYPLDMTPDQCMGLSRNRIHAPFN